MSLVCVPLNLLILTVNTCKPYNAYKTYNVYHAYNAYNVYNAYNTKMPIIPKMPTITKMPHRIKFAEWSLLPLEDPSSNPIAEFLWKY